MISSAEVIDLLKNCLYREEEIEDGKPPENAIIVEGVRLHAGLHPDRVEQAKPQIIEILKNVDPDFSSQERGGTSFMRLPFDKYGAHWGEQKHADELLILGLAIKAFEYLMPRDMWAMFAGGMPYLKLTNPKD